MRARISRRSDWPMTDGEPPRGRRDRHDDRGRDMTPARVFADGYDDRTYDRSAHDARAQDARAPDARARDERAVGDLPRQRTGQPKPPPRQAGPLLPAGRARDAGRPGRSRWVTGDG